MPYCPKCDMEFIEGITNCSDCGEPLVESKEAAAAWKKQEVEREAAKQWETDPDAEWEGDSDAEPDEDSAQKAAKDAPRTRVYVTKAQQYEELKSSATAFFLIGGLLVIISALSWLGVIKLPFAGTSKLLSQSVMTIMGLVFLYIGFTSNQSARTVQSQVGEEEVVTRQLIEWFAGSYSAEELDQRIVQDYGELSSEEHSLKRFELIEDILITTHDITNQSYVDALADEIYSKVFVD